MRALNLISVPAAGQCVITSITPFDELSVVVACSKVGAPHALVWYSIQGAGSVRAILNGKNSTDTRMIEHISWSLRYVKSVVILAFSVAV